MLNLWLSGRKALRISTGGRRECIKPPHLTPGREVDHPPRAGSTAHRAASFQLASTLATPEGSRRRASATSRSCPRRGRSTG
eukprot:160479-Alexandrium_andersonii.AAC.1